jgi:transcriptional regulator with XRE-family HTH domain
MIHPDIGGRLRRARDERGLSLHDAARLTKLSIGVLKAIERNDFTTLPGGMYRRAYIRTLAAEVGLDPNELAAAYCAFHEPPDQTSALSNRDAAEERWLRQLTPSPWPSIAGLGVIALLSSAWFWFQPELEQRRIAAASRTTESLASRPSFDRTNTVSVLQAVGTSPGVSTGGQVPRGSLRIDMAASDWCWVAAESDGERVLYRLLEPGEHVVLEGERRIALRLGNAGSVTVSVNDGPRRSPGVNGQVVELELTPDNVETLRDGAVETGSGD